MDASASFRFLALNNEMAEELVLLIPSAKIGEHYKTKNKVASIKLVDSSLIETIDEFRKKHSFSPTDCDVFISIASEKRDEVWRAPKTVNYVVNIINCPIVFSYTC